MRFIKISNDIFNYKLSTKAFITYCALSSKVNSLQYTIIKREKIADMCNLSLATLDKAIKELEQHNLIHKKNRFGAIGYKANSYFVTNLIKNNENWFKLDTRVFNTDISPTNFLVYCFLVRCKSNKNSCSTTPVELIVKYTGLSKRTVQYSTKYLKQYSFLNKVTRSLNKRTICNKYIEFKCNLVKYIKSYKAKIHKHTNTIIEPVTNQLMLNIPIVSIPINGKIVYMC